jgi:hypothetical protein
MVALNKNGDLVIETTFTHETYHALISSLLWVWGEAIQSRNAEDFGELERTNLSYINWLINDILPTDNQSMFFLKCPVPLDTYAQTRAAIGEIKK